MGKQGTGYDKLAVWHTQKDAFLRARDDYMPTPVAWALKTGNRPGTAEYREYEVTRNQWLAVAVAEFKAGNPAPLSGAGNMAEIF